MAKYLIFEKQQLHDNEEKLFILPLDRVLSRIFCLAGNRSSKNFWSHVAARKKFFRPSRRVRGHASPENFEKIVAKIAFLGIRKLH